MSSWGSSLHFVPLPKAKLLGSAKEEEERGEKIPHIKMGFLPQDSELQPLADTRSAVPYNPAGVWESWQGIPEIAEGPIPPTALSPSSSLYLDFIEEFSIQQGQLLGYFMTVEIMQCPWPVENKEEVQRLRKCNLFSYLSCILN